MFEKSFWISQVMTSWDLSYLFRKEFEVEAEVKFAELNICMLGLGVCTINGENVTNEVLTTPITKYDSRVYYNTYDVTAFLSKGSNAIGVHCGSGWYNDVMTIWHMNAATWRHMPKVIAELNIEYANGNKEQINTDLTWKAFEGGYTYNHTRLGEIFDFNKSQKGFDMPGYDDTLWKNPIIMPEPGGLILKNISEPIKVIRTIKPISIKNNIYDFGENISGWVRIIATGEKGQEMSIKYDEALDENGELLGYIDGFAKRANQLMNHKNIVIFSGAEDEEYAPQFAYFGFRYVKIENAPENIQVVAEVVHTDLKKNANFNCSDELLNKIHEASIRSTLSNFHGIPTDCPHREQNGWTGDAHLSCEQSTINFDMIKAYKKWMYDFLDAQRISGQIPAIIPNPNWWGFANAGPAWDSAMFIIPWQIYETYGDTSVLELMYEAMERYMNFLKRTTTDYICEFGLGDWCRPKGQTSKNPKCPVPVTSTAYYYVDAVIMAKTAKLLGYDSEKWQSLAENIRQAWRNKFLIDVELYKSQTFLACAIYNGLLTEDEKPVLAQKLAKLVEDNDFHTDCGILGQKYIFSALSDYGYIETVYKMVTNPTEPSYAYWINSGMTTFCETWSMTNSRNHHMFSEVDTWFYKYLGGLWFTKGEIIVNPVYLEAVSEVNVKYKDVVIKRVGKKVTVSTKEKIFVIINGEKIALENNTVSYNI